MWGRWLRLRLGCLLRFVPALWVRVRPVGFCPVRTWRQECLGVFVGEVLTDRVARLAARMNEPAEMLDEIVQRVSTPMELTDGSLAPPDTLTEICRAWDVPYGRVLAWLMADEIRYAAYRRALEMGAHALVGDLVRIADQESPYVQRDKLKIETRKYIARVHAPELYADRTEIKHSGEISFSLALQQIAARRLPRTIEPEDEGP